MRDDDHKLFRHGVGALLRLEQAAAGSEPEPALLELGRIPASRINGRAHCPAMHRPALHHRDARGCGEHQTRLDVMAWREAEEFTPRERAAPAWFEFLTELPGTGASDEDCVPVGSACTPEETAALTSAIVAINRWIRLAVGPHTPVTGRECLDLPTPAGLA